MSVAATINGTSPAVVDATAQEKKQLELGIIGMGDMGRLYAQTFANAGFKHVNVCDRPENYESLKAELAGSGLTVLKDGHHVSRRSDLIIYSVEAAFMDAVVAQYGPSTKIGSIVSGQTSVKAPERDAFEAHLPEDVFIISCHSLHGPKVSTVGQPLVLIQHRAPDDKMRLMERIMSCFKSRYVHLSYNEHDLVTANTQACTHAAFLSMGTAWKCSQAYPWETGLYPGGIETVKINIMLRIYAAKWHVYAGLALLNPAARTQIQQFADSTTSLFKLMVQEKEDELRERVFAARRGVFGWADDEEGEGGEEEPQADGPVSNKRSRKPILMSDKVLDRFHFVARKHQAGAADGVEDGARGAAPNSSVQPPNSHLSLLAIVDCWHALSINPWSHLDLAATPIFRIWIGVCEWLFRSRERLLASIRAAVRQKDFRSDDTEFVVAARGWAQTVAFGSFDLFKYRFDDTRAFFESRFAEANQLGAEMLKVLESSKVGATSS